MKIRSILALATVLALAAVITPSANAQGLKAKIPFEFRAAGEVFPAGTYVLSQVNQGTLRLQDARGRGVFIAAGPGSLHQGDNNWYVFHQYGDQRFLAGGYWAGSAVTLKIPPSPAEQEISKNRGRKIAMAIASR